MKLRNSFEVSDTGYTSVDVRFGDLHWQLQVKQLTVV